MGNTELIRRLRVIAEMGIVNAKKDVPVLRLAADRLEELDERIAIMEESALSGPSDQLPQRGSLGMIQPGANIDLLQLLPDEDRKYSGLTEEE